MRTLRRTLKTFVARLIGGGRASYLALVALTATAGATAYVLIISRGDWRVVTGIVLGGAAGFVWFGITRRAAGKHALDAAALGRAEQALARHAERLRILHEIDRALAAEETTEAIAAGVIQPLRALLGVPRAIVNLFDLAAGQVEWLAAAGRRRTHVGPGVRYSLALMGDVEKLRRGEPQIIDTHALPPGPEVDALLASGVELYMAMPMIASGELIGALSFGGPPGPFPPEQVNIAREVATQLAIAITQARLNERVKRQAEEFERRVEERTQDLRAAHGQLQNVHEELLRSASDLKEANRELEAFSYTVSHDLRAPLRAIDGFSAILEQQYGAGLDDEGRRLLGVVRRSTARMSRLIDDLLNLSRLGRVALTRAPIDMTALAASVIEELAPDSRQTGAIRLSALPPAAGDSTLLRQVWVNLIDNAIKYSAKRREPKVEISGRIENQEAVYCVRDNGAGFDARYIDKLFGVFQRLHHQNEFAGTGVGLAIVHRVVTRHGGRAWAEGRVDEGASFYFSLPIS